jgi:multicomponent Na+:H+ antiporter subunit C
MEYFLCLILFSIGLYAVMVKKNIVKVIIGISIMGLALNVLFILFGYRAGGGAPILSGKGPVSVMVDPLAQALALTTVVTGLAITLLLAALAVRLYEKYGTLDITEFKKLKG